MQVLSHGAFYILLTIIFKSSSGFFISTYLPSLARGFQAVCQMHFIKSHIIKPQLSLSEVAAVIMLIMLIRSQRKNMKLIHILRPHLLLHHK